MLSAKEDTAKVKTLNELSVQYILFENYNKAYTYANQGLEMSKKISYLKGKAVSLKNIGYTYYYKNNYEKALEYFLQSLEILKQLKSEKTKQYAVLAGIISNTYFKLNNYEKALDYSIIALDINKELKNDTQIVVNYSIIGNIYTSQQKYNEAKESYEMALNKANEINAMEETFKKYKTLH